MLPQIFLSDEILTQAFGKNPQKYADFGLPFGHEGIDLKPKKATYGVHAAEDGVVVVDDDEERGPGDPYGIMVKILSPAGRLTKYAHLSENFVKLGDRVKAGQPIGVMGETGNSRGVHVHFDCAYQDAAGRRLNVGNGSKGLVDPEKENWPRWRT